MSEALRYPSFYLAFPIGLALSGMVVTFQFSVDMLGGVLFFAIAAVAVVMLDFILRISLPPLSAFRDMDFSETRQGVVAATLCCLVAIFCLVDLVAFPIPLIVDPASYATFEDGRNHVRHISNLSWILPPLALICFKNRVTRATLIAIGLIFPVLVIDRNRLMAALFSLVLTLLMRRKKSLSFSWKVIAPLVVGGLVTFSVLGAVRSGSLDGLTLPLSHIFRSSPEGLKWLLLYVSTGVYNFSSILAKGYHNADFLIGQLAPFSGSVATLGTDIPLDAPTINVGTEFFPFLMALGWGGALISVFALYGMLLLSIVLLREDISVWRLLIFFRVAYVSVMSPFAPQAFTWTNFGFIAICLMIPIVARLLPTNVSELLKEADQ